MRIPVEIRAVLKCDDFKKAQVISPYKINEIGLGELNIKIEGYVRPYNKNQYIVTIILINRDNQDISLDSKCLFQSYFEVNIKSNNIESNILPYPDNNEGLFTDDEKSLALIYRKSQTYAIGHGCSADWKFEGENLVTQVSAESLPEYEVPSITSDIIKEDGSKLEVPMAELAGLRGENGLVYLEELITLYQRWIENQKENIVELSNIYKQAGIENIKNCEDAVKRMKEGLDYLKDKDNPIILKAFQLANHAILLQQIQSKVDKRLVRYDSEKEMILFDGKYNEPDPLKPGIGRGKWRPFQIAFILMSLKSVAEGESPERDIVDLIWFPTGGGKTEAYLGLAAFTMFLRRLRDKEDTGVSVLMRYTLRLLTAQQFLRASRLICAMEYLRKKNVEELGNKEFTIGIWLGSTTTPNTLKDARKNLRDLRESKYAKNQLLIEKCPWCGAEMGKVEYREEVPDYIPNVIGYDRLGNDVIFRCPDHVCEFTMGLPIKIIDEQLYKEPPSFLIATVDKFAMLAWEQEARALFGIDDNGQRFTSPPGLIIQDELHLISGPLGSMVGIYEILINELCTDKRGDKNISPKIIASTATISKYKEQVEALYGKKDTKLFPPPGLDAADSFFAHFAKNDDGSLKPGKKYVGINAPGLGSVQTAQVRAFSTLLQSTKFLDDDESRDPWWSCMVFFNSLRELGTTLSLLQSDIPSYLKVIKNRLGIDKWEEVRSLTNIMELTSRLEDDKISEAIAKLETRYNKDNSCVDICLASSMIEVGIDIDRLSLMAVTGQPKTTSQYIQVTSRIGRKWWERPGLIVTIYSPSKPRDRSHFEKFRSYHEKLYAQVEPTSVTPFSLPVLDRASHAIMVAYVRQVSKKEDIKTPYPYPSELINELKEIILPRITKYDSNLIQEFNKMFEKRSNEWKKWERIHWTTKWDDEDLPLLRRPGDYVGPRSKEVVWAIPTSLRNVDAECRLEITKLYQSDDFR